ncbi:hypothetical protein BJY01DRAFT_204151 [Aspergillus pseudoustus]|uniref:Uncharacterized protein n=1 Tax=Aspergillus pseudoustus TaxID=1810923 RepID=A0ABR4KUI9_9EURO
MPLLILHYSVVVRFFKPVYNESAQRTLKFEDHSEQQRYYDKIVSEGQKITRGSLKQGDKRLRCYLFRLPLHLRFRIYGKLFKHDGSAIEIGRLLHTGVGKLAILRVSHEIYHEASIALYHSLSYRRLFLRTYGAFTANLLKRFPQPLPCCGHRQYKWIKHSCRIHKAGWYRPLGSMLLLLGAADLKVALQRRWSFEEFITVLAKDDPLHVYTLTVVVTENWKTPDFDEGQLVKALFGGAFEFLGKLNFRGFTEEERDLLCKLIHERNLPNVKVEREKKKIQGSGFCIWVCKLTVPSTTLFLDALKNKIDDGKENVSGSFGSFQS